MPTSAATLIELETRFWQSMVDNKTDVALALLTEPALMVSAHGAMQFDHATYRKMAEQGPMVVTSFELSDMQVLFPNDATAIVTYRVRQTISPRGKKENTEQNMLDSSTWVLAGKDWRCVAHTETASEAPKK